MNSLFIYLYFLNIYKWTLSVAIVIYTYITTLVINNGVFLKGVFSLIYVVVKKILLSFMFFYIINLSRLTVKFFKRIFATYVSNNFI